MKKRCDRSGRDLYGVIIPNKIQVENRDELTDWIYDAAKPNRMIGEYCDEIGIPCLDLLPVLSEAYQSHRQNLYFPVDRHLTPAGTAIVAEALADFLARSAPIASRLPDLH
jgi:lysophospholipase L1-like esterase